MEAHAVIQGDARLYATQGAPPDAFLLRRVRPILEGTVAKAFSFRIMPDFGEGKALLYDAYIEARAASWLRVRVGKFKAPFGLERLQQDTDTTFTERAYPTSLAPDRDIGVDVHGEAFDVLGYAVGVFDGAPDGAMVDGDPDGKKEIAARLYVRPAKNVLFGVAATHGDKEGSASVTQLTTFKSAGQATFFTYSAETFASGQHTRGTVHAYAARGPVGVLAEYTVSRQRIRRAAVIETMTDRAWAATLAVAVTGEDESYEGVAPKSKYGAVELSARVTQLYLDKAALGAFAVDKNTAWLATTAGAGASWWVARAFRVTADWLHTDFRGGRATEEAFLLRSQLAF